MQKIKCMQDELQQKQNQIELRGLGWRECRVQSQCQGSVQGHPSPLNRRNDRHRHSWKHNPYQAGNKHGDITNITKQFKAQKPYGFIHQIIFKL